MANTVKNAGDGEAVDIKAAGRVSGRASGRAVEYTTECAPECAAECAPEYVSQYAYYMSEALAEARKAHNKGEAPVGAVIAKDGKIIARGHNEREAKNDPTLHAEISAIKKAARKVKSWRLEGCAVIVTLEPCPMCAGAIIQARLDTLVYGAPDPKAGAAGSVTDLFRAGMFNHDVKVLPGVMAEECSAILKKFFAGLRGR